MADQDIEELIVTGLVEDGGAREERIGKLVECLTLKRKMEGPENASAVACRAVSPLLDYSSLMKLRRFMHRTRGGEANRSPLRLAILGGPTTTQLRGLIEVFLWAAGITAEVYEGQYDLFRQEILSPDTKLHDFQPQIIYLATGANQVSRWPAVEMEKEVVAKLAEEELTDWAHLWQVANARWNATVIQNNFEIAPGGTFGHYALRHAASRENYLDRLNRMMAERAPGTVVMHDMRSLAAEAGWGWFDPRFHLEFKMPCSPDWLVSYAYSVVSVIRGILGKSKKVLVLDLDNTVWGGVVGDIGAGGIQVGQGSGEGEAFLAFQRYAVELQRRGVLLAVCSKNDDAKAREPFEKRDDMILKMSHISCFVANWKNKADNIRTIADRLSLKLDSFVFADDNSAERALVRRFVPEVAVPELPEDPAGYIHALARYRFFETVSFTREDVARTQYYTDNVKRQELAAGAVDLGSFLSSLQMRMRVEPIQELNIERATQLMNKSNQFNLTTNRYTVAQVREIVAGDHWRALTFSLKDRLGDNGLISVLILRKDQDALKIENWVMSCRVLQRGVENFTRNYLVELARNEGCSHIVGSFIPTAKNGMVKDHYPGMGFSLVSANEGHTVWRLDVNDGLEPLAHSIEKE